jgi:hypothetical protein
MSTSPQILTTPRIVILSAAKDLLFVFAVACFLPLIAGCQSKSPVSRDECVGIYKAYAGDKPTGTVCFTLHADSTYSLGDPQPKDGLGYFPLATHGGWQLSSDSTGQRLFIDKATLPIAKEKSSISVTVNDDLGYSCNLSKGN